MSGEFVKYRDDWQRVALLIKKTACAKRTGHGWFPPKNAFPQSVRRLLHHTIDLFEKLLLPLGSFRKWARMRLIFRRHPVVRRFHDDDVFLVLLGHETHVLAQVVQAAVPPRIVRLADDVVIHMIGIELVEKFFRKGNVLIGVRLNLNNPVCIPVQMFCSPSSNIARTVLLGGSSGVLTRENFPSRIRSSPCPIVPIHSVPVASSRNTRTVLDTSEIFLNVSPSAVRFCNPETVPTHSVPSRASKMDFTRVALG